MTAFLTSSPTGPLDHSYSVEGIDPRNSLRAHLQQCWPVPAHCLMISAFPDDANANKEMRDFFEDALIKSGLPVTSLDLWDRNTPILSREDVHGYDVILLGGGHVPTQHAFFEEIGLREKISGFPGIVIGISASSMNAAETVYAQPELPGESIQEDYVRYFTGLGLTDTQILPHYQMVKDNLLDGRRLFEDITFQDSIGHTFLVLPDGSYLLSKDGHETVHGIAYLLQDGRLFQICSENESVPWPLP